MANATQGKGARERSLFRRASGALSARRPRYLYESARERADRRGRAYAKGAGVATTAGGWTERRTSPNRPRVDLPPSATPAPRYTSATDEVIMLGEGERVAIYRATITRTTDGATSTLTARVAHFPHPIPIERWDDAPAPLVRLALHKGIALYRIAR